MGWVPDSMTYLVGLAVDVERAKLELRSLGVSAATVELWARGVADAARVTVEPFEVVLERHRRNAVRDLTWGLATGPRFP